MINNSFSQVTDVIEYKSLYRVDGKRELLLWPVWAYRVVAPKIYHQDINVLQKAVLGMCRVGETQIKKMDEMLNLGSDLLAHVFNELIMRGLIENDGTLSERGMKYYKDEELEYTEQTVGYVFQDPWAGSLWHRFQEDPFNNSIEVQDGNNSDKLILKLGTTGSPKMVPALRVLPPEESVPSTPNSREILFAVQKYKRLLKNKRYGLKQNNIETINDFADDVYDIKKISVIEEEPIPIFLVSALHLSQDNGQTKTWFATDPFGLGESWDMRKQIEDKFSEDSSLREKINKLIGKEISDGIDDYENFLRNIEEKALIVLEKRYSKKINSYPALFESLVSLQSRYNENKASNRPSKFLIKNIMRDSTEPIEAIFSHIFERYPVSVEYLEKTITDDKEHNKSIYNSIADSFGFSSPLPNRLVSVEGSKIFGIIVWKTTTLRPLVLLNFLAARKLSDHPIRVIGKTAPDLFEKISYVADNRDSQSHFAREDDKIYNVDEQVESTFYVVEVLLNQLEKNIGVKNGKK